MSIFFDHHIILERFRGHDAFRGVDKQMFDIDSPANRIYLPADQELAAKLRVSPHSGRHVSSYSKSVKEKLDEIATTPDPRDRAAEIRTLIDAMRVGFANGDLYTNMPIDKTRQEVDRSNARVFADHKAYLSQHPEQLRTVRDLEQRGAEAGLDHLIKWLLYLDNPERRKQVDELIGQSPDVNITAGNQDLDGTHWHSKFGAIDPSSGIFVIPGSTPVNPRDFRPLPGYTSPSLRGLNEPEGFGRSDPRFTGVLPAFPAPNPEEQRLGQLPPSTAMPSPPQVLQFNPETSDLLKFTDGSPVMGPDQYNMPHDPADGPAVLRGMALFAAAMATPALLPLLPALAPIAALGLAGATAARAEPSSEKKGEPSVAGASPYGAFNPNDDTSSTVNFDREPGARRAASQAAGNSLDQGLTSAGTVDERFGHWIVTPSGIMPDPLLRGSEPPVAGAVAPAEVRRLTRVNASNAGNVFTSGSAPVPYLPPTEFNGRFGNWTMPTADGRARQTSGPIGASADEPSYFIPPPIFGVDDPGNPRNDAEEWFSRWIRPLLRSE